MTLIILPSADLDLFEIWDYIAGDSFKQADKMSAEFNRVFLLLAQNPEMGRTRDELKEELRSFAVGNYIIFYQSLQEGIQVVRVLHGAMDIPEIFE